MKNTLVFLLCFNVGTAILAQGIGELAPEKEPTKFPPRTLGLDIMFSEGGFGLGGFWRQKFTDELTFSADFSISEAKDEKEFEFVDYFGNVIVYGKKNRIFLLPFYGGLQYRLFSQTISDNLRPYLNLAVGPTMVVTTPYDKEFFNAFHYARAYYTLGGYVGFGANFGLDQKSVMGINIRYYVIHFFDQGIESLYNRYQKELGGFYLTINIGSMY
jgi:hypothetical protein